MGTTAGTDREKPCVLVVEDDPPLRRLITVALRREAVSVTTAKNGLEAIRCMTEGRFLVVLLDLMMPGMNGWDVIEWMKAHEGVRPKTVIVVTAADRNVFGALDPVIVNAIIVKPFDIKALTGYVRGACSAHVERDRRSKRVVGAP